MAGNWISYNRYKDQPHPKTVVNVLLANNNYVYDQLAEDLQWDFGFDHEIVEFQVVTPYVRPINEWLLSKSSR